MPHYRYESNDFYHLARHLADVAEKAKVAAMRAEQIADACKSIDRAEMGLIGEKDAEVVADQNLNIKAAKDEINEAVNGARGRVAFTSLLANIDPNLAERMRENEVVKEFETK